MLDCRIFHRNTVALRPGRPGHMPVPSVIAISLGVAICSGCRLINTGPAVSRGALEKIGLRMQRPGSQDDAIQLEFIMVQRTEQDPLMGPELWDHLDTIGRRPARMRAALAGHGFKVGQVGTTPPSPLEALLRPSADGAPAAKDQKGWRIYLRDGGETEVVLGEQPRDTQRVTLVGARETTEYHNVRYLVRIRARRLRDGWLRLECLPEIHHGRQRLQPTATEAGWGLRTRQDIVPIYDLAFTVDLTEGEMTVMTASGEASADSLAHKFFDVEDGRSRVLLARLARLPDLTPAPRRLAR